MHRLIGMVGETAWARKRPAPTANLLTQAAPFPRQQWKKPTPLVCWRTYGRTSISYRQTIENTGKN